MGKARAGLLNFGTFLGKLDDSTFELSIATSLGRSIRRTQYGTGTAEAIVASIGSRDAVGLREDLAALVPSAALADLDDLAQVLRKVVKLSGQGALRDLGKKGKAAQPSGSAAAKAGVIRAYIESVEGGSRLSKWQFAQSETVASICKRHGVKVDPHTTVYSRWLSRSSIEQFKEERTFAADSE